MKRVAVTQLHEFVRPRGEYRDALDSGWAPLLEAFGLVAIQLPNLIVDPRRFIREVRPDAILLTGGGSPGTPESRSRMEQEAIQYAISRGLPLLGVCRGMQVINLYFQGSLSRVRGHVGVEHEVFRISDGPQLGESVNSYHEFAVDSGGIGTGLIPTVHAADGTIEAFHHRHLPWSGVMWHPERERELSEISAMFLKELASGRKF